MKLFLIALLACSPALSQSKPAANPWRETFEQRLPYFGHRNWIVIADSAYPLQSGPGIETILSNESQIDTVRHVLTSLAKVPHVRPVVFTDKELSFVAEQDAVGIGAYRQLLAGIFESKLPEMKINTIPHEEIIHRLDEAGKTFNVLIIKTNMTLPYTSVFLQLAASYWSDDAENRLRQAVH